MHKSSNARQRNHNNEACDCLCKHLHSLCLYCGYKEGNMAPQKWQALTVNEVQCFFVARASKETQEESDLKGTQNEKQHQTNTCLRVGTGTTAAKDSEGIKTPHTGFLLLLLKLAFDKRAVWSPVCREAAIPGARLAKKLWFRCLLSRRNNSDTDHR